MKTIDKFLNFLISLLLLPVMMSCSDTDLDVSDAPFAQPGDRAATIEVPLRLHADAPSVNRQAPCQRHRVEGRR